MAYVAGWKRGRKERTPSTEGRTGRRLYLCRAPILTCLMYLVRLMDIPQQLVRPLTAGQQIRKSGRVKVGACLTGRTLSLIEMVGEQMHQGVRPSWRYAEGQVVWVSPK